MADSSAHPAHAGSSTGGPPAVPTPAVAHATPSTAQSVPPPPAAAPAPAATAPAHTPYITSTMPVNLPAMLLEIKQSLDKDGLPPLPITDELHRTITTAVDALDSSVYSFRIGKNLSYRRNKSGILTYLRFKDYFQHEFPEIQNSYADEYDAWMEKHAVAVPEEDEAPSTPAQDPLTVACPMLTEDNWNCQVLQLKWRVRAGLIVLTLLNRDPEGIVLAKHRDEIGIPDSENYGDEDRIFTRVSLLEFPFLAAFLDEWMAFRIGPVATRPTGKKLGKFNDQWEMAISHFQRRVGPRKRTLHSDKGYFIIKHESVSHKLPLGDCANWKAANFIDLLPLIDVGRQYDTEWTEGETWPEMSEEARSCARLWARSVWCLMRVALDQDKLPVLAIKQLIAEYSKRCGVKTSRVRDIGGNYRLEPHLGARAEPTLRFRLRSKLPQDLGPEVQFYLTAKPTLTQETITRLWDALLRNEPKIWNSLGALALLYDLALHPVFYHCDEACFYVLNLANPDSDQLEELEGCPVHISSVEKKSCEKSFFCALCSTTLKCSETPPRAANLNLCPEHMPLFQGNYGCHPNNTPLRAAINGVAARDPSADLESNPKSCKAYQDQLKARFGVKSDLYVASVPFLLAPESFHNANLVIADLPTHHSVKLHESFTPSITRDGAFGGGYLYFLNGVFRAAERPSDSKLVKWRHVDVYKSAYTELESYDDHAIPPALRASLDQHRVFAPFADHTAVQHTLDNVQVVPAWWNCAKHTQAPEWLALFAQARWLKVGLLPILHEVDVDLQNYYRQWLQKTEKHWTTSIIETRIKLANNPKKIDEVRRAYIPIIEYGKLHGLQDSFSRQFKMPATSQGGTVTNTVADGEEVSSTINLLSAVDILRGDDPPPWLFRSKPLSTEERTQFEQLGGQALFDLWESLHMEGEPRLPLNGANDPWSALLINWKIWHFNLLTWWCDEDGYHQEFVFFAFWMCNIYELVSCGGLCHYLGLQLNIRDKDLMAVSDSHRLHGLSMVYKLTNCPVSELEGHANILYKQANFMTESRTTNFMRKNYLGRHLVLVDRVVLEMGGRMLAQGSPTFLQLLQKNETVMKRISEAMVAEKLYDSHEDVQLNSFIGVDKTHRFHPCNGIAHVTGM